MTARPRVSPAAVLLLLGGGVAGRQNEGEAENVTAELLRRGYSERDIGKLWGGNFLRVWGEAQKRKAKAQ